MLKFSLRKQVYKGELVALDGGTEYWFLVGALSEAGESGRSGSVVQSTAPPRGSSIISSIIFNSSSTPNQNKLHNSVKY